MLAGRALEFADLERSIAEPSSIVDGRWLSREGLEDAGDLTMLSWDLDLESNNGRGGSGANSGFNEGLPIDELSCARGWLIVRL